MTLHVATWPKDPRDGNEGHAGADGGGADSGVDVAASPPRPDEAAIWTGRDLRWEQLVEVSRELGPDPALAHLDDDQLERQVRGQAAAVAAATCRYLHGLAELVVRGIWADQGARTPGEWLSWALGLGPSTARDHVRVALRLRELPKISERFAAGTLSFSKVRALTRIATPELEDDLLRWADHATAGELEEVVRSWRQVRRAVTAATDPYDRPDEVRTRYSDDGRMQIVIETTPERGVELLDRLEWRARREEAASAEASAPTSASAEAPAGSASAEASAPTSASAEAPAAGSASAEAPELFDSEAVKDGPLDHPPSRPGHGERMVDALLDTLAAAGQDEPGDTTGEDRHTLVLHAPLEALAGGDDPRPTVPVGGRRRRVPAMSPSTLRRLACDAGLVLVANDRAGSPVDVGRRHRHLTAALRRALRARDRGCRFPGCAATRHLHAHHVVHWAEGGPTDLANPKVG